MDQYRTRQTACECQAMTRQPIVLSFNLPREGGDPNTWAYFYVPKGGLSRLVDDERAYRMMSGDPFVVALEDPGEAEYLHELVTALGVCRRAVEDSSIKLSSTGTLH
jgi:hypothetical protein